MLGEGCYVQTLHIFVIAAFTSPAPSTDTKTPDARARDEPGPAPYLCSIIPSRHSSADAELHFSLCSALCTRDFTTNPHLINTH